ncbi:uncharacterized protein N7482_000074 [Penicillium canariense]|uniref:Uncharacterized protein n=1 Tax=Penicillium canariense TaxID=189055 RepID=A0A9W9LSS9_9EURO|nr:uncharacterized protein N7482_000074 [Penicillium canariense]KAJ5174197.1 hypothetical protein N7482_000074 [Penicillium canariense]
MVYGIPSPEGRGSVLVASLTEFGPVDEARLIQTLQHTFGDGYCVQIWHPPKVGLPQPLSKKKDRRDTKANIYGLAVLALRTGQSSFLVADRLTKRQLTGDPRPGESPVLSLVMVGIRPPLRTRFSSEEDAQSEHVRVIAKRYTIHPVEHENESIPNLLGSFDLSYTFLGGSSIDITTRLCEYGLELHDPDHGVFISDTTATGREKFERDTKAALLDSTPLPAELVTSIVSCMDHRCQSDFVPPSVEKENLVIFLAFPTTEDERQHLQFGIQREVQRCVGKRTGRPAKRKRDDDHQQINVQLVPWEHKRHATRRDLEYHWKEVHDPALCPLNYLLAPIESSLRQRQALGEAQFGSIYHSNDGFVLMARNTLDHMAKTKLNYPNGELGKIAQLQQKVREGTLPDSSEVEFLIGPDDPFYYNPPLWEPVDGEGLISIAVFYLTNKLSDDQIRALKAELLTDKELLDHQKACCFVPWEDGDPNAPDGTIHDIWSIFWDMRRCTSCEMPIFFIDEQSGVDQTVIMVDIDHFFWHPDDEQATKLLSDVEDPSTKGLLYGRVKGRNAHDGHMNLSRGNMNFDEFLESCGLDAEHRYPRPGWPGHGILENED